MDANTPRLALELQLTTQSDDQVTIAIGEVPVLNLRAENVFRYAVQAVNFLRSGSQAVQIIYELTYGSNDHSERHLALLSRVLRALQRPTEKFSVHHMRELDEGQSQVRSHMSSVSVFTVRRTLDNQ